MTDKGVLDAAQQAIRIEELNGRQNLLSLQITQGLHATRTAIEGTQSEVHKLVGVVERLAAFQTDHASNKDALEMLRRQMDGVSNRMEQLFNNFSATQERKWDAYALDRDQRWREHEAENEDTTRTLRTEINDIREKEVRKLREQLIRWTGWGAGIGGLAALVVSIFMYHLDYRFGDNVKTTDQLEVKTEVLSRELAEIKLYLARGGRAPSSSRLSQPQRNEDNDDGKSEPAN